MTTITKRTNIPSKGGALGGFLLIILSFSLFSCTEKIDIKTGTTGSYLNIFGYITTDTMQHRIQISGTTPYFSNQQAQVFSGATVTISDGENSYLLTENPDTAGLYLTTTDFFGVPGKNYTLDVSVDYQGNGVTEHFRASDFMPLPLHFDTVFISSVTTLGMPNFSITGNLPYGQVNNIAIYVSKKGQKVQLFDSFINMLYWQFDEYEFKNLEFPFMFEDEDIYAGDTIILNINMMSTELITYVNNVQTELMGVNPIFGGPPVNLETNIIHLNPHDDIRVVGYFGAFSKSETFVVTEKDYK